MNIPFRLTLGVCSSTFDHPNYTIIPILKSQEGINL